MGVNQSKFSVGQDSYVKTERTPQTDPNVRTIPQCLEHYAKVLPYKEAVVFISTEDQREYCTFKQLYEKSRTVAHNLLSLGVRQNDVLAISLRTCPEWLYVAFGAMFAGIRPFPIPFTYKDGHDVVEVFQKLKTCSCMVMDRGTQDENWNIFLKLLDSYDIDGKVKSKQLPSLRYLVGYRDCITGAKSTDDLLREADEYPDLPEIREDDIAIFLQSSGSTGVPKIITHTHKSLMTFRDIELGSAFSEIDTFLNERSFSWIGGFSHGLFVGQTRVTYSGMCAPPEDKISFMIGVIKKERCTSCLAMTTVIHDLLKRKEQLAEDWSLKTILTGGQPMTQQTVACVGQICTYIVVIYGGSEIGWISANVMKDPAKFTEHNCGQILTNREVKVVDPEENIVPVGEIGEIYIRGDNIFHGYYSDIERTKAVLAEDGWYKTDDVGQILTDGSLVVRGRVSNKINTGGFIIYPEILETELKSCRGVDSAVIVPVPDDIEYQVICACVKVVPGSGVNEEVLRKLGEDRLGDTERVFTVLPKHYLILESFPETNTGKVSRKALEAMAKDKFAK